MKQNELLEKSKGLYYYVNKNKKSGKKPRKKGAKGAPTDQDWKDAAKTAKENTNEGLAELAGVAERDHEIQMARADLYKIAKYAIKLHEMLKGVTETEGMQGWQQSKITKAADYMGSVYHAMDYENKFEGVTEGKSPHKKGSAKYKKHMAAKHANMGEDYKESIRNKLQDALNQIEEKKQKGVDGKACWDGYKRMGTKKKGGKTVDNCVKMSPAEKNK